jgi:hypothetical protein
MRWVTFEQSWRRDGRVGSSVHGPAPTGMRRYKRALKHIELPPRFPKIPQSVPQLQTTPDGTLVRSPPTIHKRLAHRLSDRIARFFPRNLESCPKHCQTLSSTGALRRNIGSGNRPRGHHPATTDTPSDIGTLGILSHIYEILLYTYSTQGPSLPGLDGRLGLLHQHHIRLASVPTARMRSIAT